MSHGNKKWVRTYDGRIKRSRHRTADDRKGKYAFESMRDRRDCPECEALRQAHGGRWRWAAAFECDECRFAWWVRFYADHRHYGAGVTSKKAWKRIAHSSYRRQVKDRIKHGDYEAIQDRHPRSILWDMY